MQTDCIFCKIIDKQIPATVIDENDELIVLQDVAPKAPVHYLIIPKKHVKDVQSLEADDALFAGKLLMKAHELGKKLDKDFRLVINSGAGAGQKVFHLHIHFLAGKTMTDAL